MIESYLLEELTVFAKTGTLTQTAAQLNVTQPSVTRGMQKLEDDFGVKLFERQSNRIRLTPTGELAAKEAARVLEASAAMVTKVQNYDHSRHVTPLAATVPGPLILLNQLQGTLKENIQVADTFVPTEKIANALNNNQYALIFSNQEIFADNIESLYVGEERLQVCLDQFMYLANQSTVTFDELKGLSFIVMRAIGPWGTIIQDEIANAKFMSQDDRDSFAEITKYSRFPFFTTNLSQSDPFFKERVKADADRVTVPISNDSAQMPIYASYLLSQKERLSPLISDIRQQWPTALQNKPN
ncbi:LysR family transcriptional regulator [Levilactobacillus humaensis]|uniref:LysR family transcriptional regulator n=1 Tax=Levilactobacillus humaensis TaxID=2950375 RepID=UPI0021C35093|nr:LysR family transcriptional regulator [Levilactobacillus humaensis]